MPAGRIVSYMRGCNRSDEIRAIDSLERRALMRELLFYRNIDRAPTVVCFENMLQRQLGHRVDPNEVRSWLETYMRQDASAPAE